MKHQDKLIHFVGGAGIAFILGLALFPLAGLIGAAVVGVGKEVWDSMGHGTPEALDTLATIAGGGVVFAAMLALQ